MWRMACAIAEEEFSLREDRLLANISDLIETSRWAG